nr:MAG TPA: hypothetical protein [Caudoviricetes sp.]
MQTANGNQNLDSAFLVYAHGTSHYFVPSI